MKLLHTYRHTHGICIFNTKTYGYKFYPTKLRRNLNNAPWMKQTIKSCVLITKDSQ